MAGSRMVPSASPTNPPNTPTNVETMVKISACQSSRSGVSCMSNLFFPHIGGRYPGQMAKSSLGPVQYNTRY